MAPMDPPGYCFPNISANGAERCSVRSASPPAFRRLPPGASEADCRRGKSRMVRSAEQSRVDLEQEAYCRGFSDGEKNGFTQGERAASEAVERRLEPLLEGLQQLLAELESLQSRACHDLENELVHLALGVARRIVGREVQVDPQVVAGIIRDALSRVEHAEQITIRMNPADMDCLAELKPGILDSLADAGRARFEADASVSSGGCRIESDSGDIDARIEQRFQIVEDAFQAEWNKDEPT
jgi:flagellar biosynthesis/type III secretory pathway protein FliH